MLEDLAGGPVSGVCERSGVLGGLEGVELAFDAVDAVEGEFAVGGGLGVDGHLVGVPCFVRDYMVFGVVECSAWAERRKRGLTDHCRGSSCSAEGY